MDETAVSPVRFTPGPWQRIGTDIGTADGGKLAMACVENGNTRDALKRMHANAALIVEAPAMYQALTAVAYGSVRQEMLDEIRDLIARIDRE